LVAESREPSQKSIEVTHSINIISMGVHNKGKRRRGAADSPGKRVMNESFINPNRRHLRSSNPSSGSKSPAQKVGAGWAFGEEGTLPRCVPVAPEKPSLPVSRA
jgi:hypothetical protein